MEMQVLQDDSRGGPPPSTPARGRAVKIVHFTTAHPPFDVRVFHKECGTLAAAGHEVVLIAPHTHDERVGGVQLRAIRRAGSRLQRMTAAVRDAFRRAVHEDADVYHFHDPELIPVALLLKLRGKRVVYDVHEDLPRTIAYKPWIAPALRYPLIAGAEVIEWVASVAMDGIVAATPAIARRFARRRVEIVQNFPLEREMVAPGARPFSERPRLAAYIGAVSEHRGIHEMVRAFELLSADGPTRLSISGGFASAHLKERMEQEVGWKCVDYTPWRSRSELAALLATARLGLVIFHPVPNHVEAQPNKLFEYMAAGLPVVASDFPLWREIVGGARCGLLVDPLDPEAIARAVRWLMDHPEEAEEMGRRGQQAVETLYSWSIEGEKLVEFYARLVQ